MCKEEQKNNLNGCTYKVQKDDPYIVYSKTLKVSMNYLNKEEQENLLKKVTEMGSK